jgi:hypothetical protein
MQNIFSELSNNLHTDISFKFCICWLLFPVAAYSASFVSIKRARNYTRLYKLFQNSTDSVFQVTRLSETKEFSRQPTKPLMQSHKNDPAVFHLWKVRAAGIYCVAICHKWSINERSRNRRDPWKIHNMRCNDQILLRI